MTEYTPTVESVRVTRGVAGQLAADVTLSYDYGSGPVRVTSGFVGSVYGGPVTAIGSETDEGFQVVRGWQVRVTDPDRYGDFATDPKAWVERFYA